MEFLDLKVNCTIDLEDIINLPIEEKEDKEE